MWESSAIGLKQIVNVLLAAIAGALGVLVVGEARETFPQRAPSPSASATAAPQQTPEPTAPPIVPAQPPKGDQGGKGHGGKGSD